MQHAKYSLVMIHTPLEKGQEMAEGQSVAYPDGGVSWGGINLCLLENRPNAGVVLRHELGMGHHHCRQFRRASCDLGARRLGRNFRL